MRINFASGVTSRDGGVLHRDGITGADKLAAATSLTTGVDVGTGGSLAFATTFNITAVPGNRWGPAGPAPAVLAIATANDAANTHCVRGALAQVADADYYDIFMTTAAAPLWVGRITEAQRAAAGCRITALGVVDNAGAGAAGTVQVHVLGTGLASNVNPFILNNAYRPDNSGIVAVNCAGYTKAYILSKLAVTDLRSLPTLKIVPFLANQVSSGDWAQAQLQTQSLLTAVGESLIQNFVVTVEGSTGLKVLVDTISAQGGSAASVWVELA